MKAKKNKKFRLHKHIHRHIKRVVTASIRILRGFTLIELVLVIAIIGIMVSLLLFVINPAQQFARARDTSRKIAISQIGDALERYYALTGSYPTSDDPTNFKNTLINTGQIKSFPINPTGITNQCNSVDGTGAINVNGYCYNVSLPDSFPMGAVVYSQMESISENRFCTDTAWRAWSAVAQRFGITCTPSQTEEPPVVLTAFVDETAPPPEETTPSETPLPSVSSTPDPTPTPTSTPLPSPTPSPTPSSTPSPTPVTTPSPTPSPVPSPTPITCTGIGGTCKRTCSGSEYNAGKLNCTGRNTCCAPLVPPL